MFFVKTFQQMWCLQEELHKVWNCVLYEHTMVLLGERHRQSERENAVCA